GTTVTISGNGFTNATGVLFGATSAAFSVGSDGSITATSPPHTGGVVDVEVVNRAGSSLVSTNDHFSYLAVPTISSLSVGSGPSAGGTAVTINGAGLSNVG